VDRSKAASKPRIAFHSADSGLSLGHTEAVFRIPPEIKASSSHGITTPIYTTGERLLLLSSPSLRHSPQPTNSNHTAPIRLGIWYL